MFNSRIIDFDFEYSAPLSLKEALEALGKPGARALAGGTDLLNRLRDGRDKPSLVVWLGRVNGLADISASDGFLRIGAAAPMREIERYFAAGLAGAGFAALAEAINSVGGTQIRNVATLGGNIGNASPGADTPPAIIALGGEIESARLDGKGAVAVRRTPAEKFFTGPGKTILERGELVTAVILPLAGAGTGAGTGPGGNVAAAGAGSAFRKLARVTLDIAKTNCAVWIRREGDTIAAIRVALGSVAPTPVRAVHVEKGLIGRRFGIEAVKSAAAETAADAAPITDIRSSREYRQAVLPVLAADMITEAYARSGGNI